MADWYHVKDIVEDADGSFWIATANYGIIHIMGDVQHPETLKYSNYSYNNGQLATNSVLCLHVDKSGRLWAGTEGGGLYLYDYKENVFTEKNQEYQLSADMIGSIEEDRQGCLWMGTNMGLVQLLYRWTRIWLRSVSIRQQTVCRITFHITVFL